jgi:hypothetical protein
MKISTPRLLLHARIVRTARLEPRALALMMRRGRELRLVRRALIWASQPWEAGFRKPEVGREPSDPLPLFDKYVFLVGAA